ncbi:MAG TPA: hypothetical protein IGS52_09120 [Oscillatoriaceae cyanobacterium M33_DOE_052]|nr:hypothetical protein [Oscillatoriaceae cyanobacterium M33_DOE_052]
MPIPPAGTPTMIGQLGALSGSESIAPHITPVPVVAPSPQPSPLPIYLYFIP